MGRQHDTPMLCHPGVIFRSRRPQRRPLVEKRPGKGLRPYRGNLRQLRRDEAPPPTGSGQHLDQGTGLQIRIAAQVASLQQGHGETLRRGAQHCPQPPHQVHPLCQCFAADLNVTAEADKGHQEPVVRRQVFRVLQPRGKQGQSVGLRERGPPQRVAVLTPATPPVRVPPNDRRGGVPEALGTAKPPAAETAVDGSSRSSLGWTAAGRDSQGSSAAAAFGDRALLLRRRRRGLGVTASVIVLLPLLLLHDLRSRFEHHQLLQEHAVLARTLGGHVDTSRDSPKRRRSQQAKLECYE